MRRVGQARRRDANEKAIVEDLRAFGRYVIRHGGAGEPDLFVQRDDGLFQAFEVKRDGKAGFTQSQREAMVAGRLPWPVVTDSDQALAYFVRRR